MRKHTIPPWVLHHGLLVLLCLFHVFANLWWLRADNHSILSDESLHMGYARDYYTDLFLRPDVPLDERLADMFNRQAYYPPLMHLTGALLMGLFGYGQDTMAFAGTLYFVVLLLGVRAFAGLFLSRWHALYATFVASCTPLVFGASRNFMTDYPSAALVVWCLYLLARTDCFTRTGWVFGFALVNAAALLSRQTSLVFYLPPCALLVVLGLARGGQRRIVALNAVLCLVVSGALVVPWHLHHYAFLKEFWLEQFYGGQGLMTGPGSGGGVWLLRGTMALIVSAVAVALAHVWVWKKQTVLNALARPRTLLCLQWLFPVLVVVALLISRRLGGYAGLLLDNGVFLPLFLLVLAGMPLSFRLRKHPMPVVLLHLWLVGGFMGLAVLFSSQVSRYLVPLAPAVAIFTTIALVAIRGPVLRRAALAGLAAVLLLTYAKLTFPGAPGPGRVGLQPKATPGSRPTLLSCGWPLYKDHVIAGDYAFHAAQRRDGFADRILSAMVRDMEERRPVYTEQATYRRLTDQELFEGMAFAQVHYDPEPNPYADPRRKTGMRPLRAAGHRWHHRPSEMTDQLGTTDFVVMKVATREGKDPEEARAKEAAWLEYFRRKGFVPVTQFAEARYNNQPGGLYSLLGREVRESKPVKRWEFAALRRADWEWDFGNAVRMRPEGVSWMAKEAGPALTHTALDLEAADFNTVRLKLHCEEQNGDDSTEEAKLIFYWASPEAVATGQWPFSLERGVRLHQVGEDLFEATLNRHPEWRGAIGAAMFGLDLPGDEARNLPVVRTYDFARTPEADWGWTFEGGADRAPLGMGAHWMRRSSGPMATLDEALKPTEVRGIRVEMDVRAYTKRAQRNAQATGLRLYWAQGNDPFSESRMRPLAREAGDRYATWTGTLPNLAGSVPLRIQLGAVLLPEALPSATAQYSLRIRKIELLGPAPAPAAYRVSVGEVSFLK